MLSGLINAFAIGLGNLGLGVANLSAGLGVLAYNLVDLLHAVFI
jgi:hypothetical protein